MQTEHNWAGNYTYSATRLHEPGTLDDVRALVKRSRSIRALGSRHSFNAIGDSREDLVSLARLNRVVSLDREGKTVTIEGGMRYGQLGQYLHEHGLALRNLASLPHISVAGACATATHGSGEGNGNLATSVRAMQIISPEGDLVTVSRETHPDDFDGMVVSLGALGIVAAITLDVIDTFDVAQTVYENLSLESAAQNFDAIQASAYSVSLFTNWQQERFDQMWLKDVSEPARPDILFGARKANGKRHPLRGLSAEHCTEQRGARGAWHDRLPHFRMDFTPSSGEELQSEYFVPRQHAVDALRAMMQLGDRIAPHLLVSEIRTIAADGLWLSPSYEQPMMAIHFTWKQDWPAVRALLPDIESVLAPFGGRPHWGKLFTMSAAQIEDVFVKLPDFRRLLDAHDPNGKFRNAFVDSCIFGHS